MKNLPNIEPSGFHRGQYVGYANGPWRITRKHRGWQATMFNIPHGYMQARTLAALSAKLTAYEKGQAA